MYRGFSTRDSEPSLTIPVCHPWIWAGVLSSRRCRKIANSFRLAARA